MMMSGRVTVLTGVLMMMRGAGCCNHRNDDDYEGRGYCTHRSVDDEG